MASSLHCLRVHTKKKKKSKCGTNESNVIHRNATYSGHFYHKGMLSWTQRFCTITGGQLLCYRAEKDSKPVLALPLAGRDVLYTERTDSRFVHAIRVSRPGSETHWFYTESRCAADAWLTVWVETNNLMSKKEYARATMPHVGLVN